MELIKSFKHSIKDIFKDEEQSNNFIEIKEDVKTIIDNISQYHLFIKNYGDNILTEIKTISDNIKESYNLNFLSYNNINDKLSDINGSLSKHDLLQNNILEQLKENQPKTDYLTEQRENTKIEQGKTSIKLLSDMLSEIRSLKVGIKTISIDNENSKDNGGIIGNLLGGLSSALGLGYAGKKGVDLLKGGSKGIKGAKKAKDLAKMTKNISKAVKVGRLGLAGTGVGVSLLVVDEMFGITDKLIDYGFEMYTDMENKNETVKKKSDKLLNNLNKKTTIPNWLTNYSPHPAITMISKLWDEFESNTETNTQNIKNETIQNEKESKGLIAKLGEIYNFFGNNHNPMDIMYKFYTDKKGFNNLMSEFSGIVLGNTMEKVDELYKNGNPTNEELMKVLQPSEMLNTFNTLKQPEMPQPIKQDGQYTLPTDNPNVKTLITPQPDGSVKGKLYNLDDLIKDAAIEHGLQPNFLKAVIAAESGFNTQAISHAGATGLTQMTPIAAKDINADWEKIVNDPEYNVRKGAEYLSKQMQRFKGNKELALSAYNAGPTITAKTGRIANNPETRAYVPRVLDYERQYNLQTKKETEQTNLIREAASPALNSNSTNTVINNINNSNTTQSEDDNSLVRINSSSPFDIAYAKLFMNPNYNKV